MRQIQVPTMRQSGEHSSCAIDSVDRFSDDTETPEDSGEHTRCADPEDR